MKNVHRKGIDYPISEPEIHNQNPVWGVIRGVSRECHHTMVNKILTRQLWDYGVSWVSEVISMTCYSANSVNIGIPLTNMTSKNVDISEHLGFGLYERFWCKDNYGLYPSETVSWLGISHQTGTLLCYCILTQTGKCISRSTVQQVTNIELYTDEVKESFVYFDAEINQRLKSEIREYEGSKPCTQD